MNCLTVANVSFERDDVPLLSNVDAQWRSGDIVQLAGHNGCGKSTLMRLIAGLNEPSSGAIHWNEHKVKSYEYNLSLLYLGHHIGVKLTMTPLENLAWYFGLNGAKTPDTEVTTIPSSESLSQALDKVGLYPFQSVPCYQLSAGQLRRVALARLYLSKAPLWVLDEPFTAIDKSGVSELEQLIEQHAQSGAVVLLTTHQAWQAKQINIIDVTHYNTHSQEGE